MHPARESERTRCTRIDDHRVTGRAVYYRGAVGSLRGNKTRTHAYFTSEATSSTPPGATRHVHCFLHVRAPHRLSVRARARAYLSTSVLPRGGAIEARALHLLASFLMPFSRNDR